MNSKISAFLPDFYQVATFGNKEVNKTSTEQNSYSRVDVEISQFLLEIIILESRFDLQNQKTCAAND